MARKKKSRKSRASLTPVVLAALAGFAAGVAVALAAVWHSGLLSVPAHPMQETARVEPPPPAPEVRPSPVPSPAPYPRLPEDAPRVAVVIDDMGRDITRLRELLDIDAPVTIAVLPHLQYSEATAYEAHTGGRDVIMHLPMEPRDPVNDPGAGALLTSMGPGDIREVMDRDLATVPYAIGINNHMGSRFTEDEQGMRTVLETVREKGLFFLDSRTTSRSVGVRLAGELGVRSIGRSVFLDNERDVNYILGQLSETVEIARKTGSAIAIGHPYPETIAALRLVLPGLAADGVAVVRLSELVGDAIPARTASPARALGP
jgi:polysaccharide deacetylase 2 family uncharacterized protein YibQ